MNQTQPQQPPASPPRRRRPQFHHVQVSRLEHLAQHLVRATFTGPELSAFATHGPAEHLKVWFPNAGEEWPTVPAWTDDGPVWPEGAVRPVTRTYTPRLWNPDSLELAVDFVVHGEGVASSWASKAQVGDKVVVTMPGGPYRMDPEATRYVIGGDESAIPAIGTILEALPANARAEVFLEVEGSSDELELTSPASIELHWLHRGATGPEAVGRTLEPAIRDAELPAGARVFVACEAEVMRDIRRHLVNQRGLERGAFHTHGYWKLGTANHPDHDLGEDA